MKISRSPERQVPSPGKRASRIGTVTLKGMLLTFLALISFPYRFAPIDAGLDPSWIFAINYFFDNNFVFGKDVIWTYGPLGFLSYPLDIGANLDIATAFQIFLWAGFLLMMGYLALTNRFSLAGLSIFVALYTCGQAVYYLGYIGYDYVILFYVFFLLSFSLVMKRWLLSYSLALFFSGLLLFIKFSSAILSILSLLSFLLAAAFADKGKAIRALCLSLALPIFFVLVFMIYHPSFAVLWAYMKGAYQLVVGYSIAMSKPGRNADLVLAFIIAFLFGLFMIILCQKKEKSFYLAGAFIVPMWFSFKHGFVRQDTHVLIFFSTALFLIGLIMLLSNVRTFMKRALCLTIGITGIWLMVFIQHMSPTILFSGVGGIITLNNMKAALQFGKTKENLSVVSQKNLGALRLPRHILDSVGTSSLGIFPWEISYAAAHDLTFRPFPVFQADNAYTAYLDRLNAEFLEDPSAAPEFLLVEWKSVDDRHPLIDVPVFWLSLYTWYDLDQVSSGPLLLKRRATPRVTRLDMIKSNNCDKDAFIAIPNFDKPVVMKLSLT
jgi:hypothetical protein